MKTDGLTINQNSSNNRLALLTEGTPDFVTVAFTYPNGKQSPSYHLVYRGEYTPTVEEIAELSKYTQTNVFQQWDFLIPYGDTAFTIAGATAKLAVSFACYERDQSGIGSVSTVANAQIVVNRSGSGSGLDMSYNGADVNNLWKKVGELTKEIITLSERINAVQNLIPRNDEETK